MEKSVRDQEQLDKLPTKKLKAIKKLPKDHIDQVEGLIDAIQAVWIEEFIEYIKSPWKMLWPNFIAGVARGFGALVGAALVITIIGWIFSFVIDLPLIGKKLEPYIEKVQIEFRKYTEATNYKEDFKEMKEMLKNIEKNTQKK